MFRNFKVAVVARTSVRMGCKRTEVRATLKKGGVGIIDLMNKGLRRLRPWDVSVLRARNNY